MDFHSFPTRGLSRLTRGLIFSGIIGITATGYTQDNETIELPDKVDKTSVQAPIIHSTNPKADLSTPWTITLDGYFRVLYSHIQADQNLEFVGEHNGFVFPDARATLRGDLTNGLGFVFGVDAASSISSSQSPVSKLGVQMTDSYVYYAPFQFLQFDVGQFKTPFDVEEQISTSALLFTHRSVGNEGVKLHEGRQLPGISVDRQIGLQVRGKPYYFLNPDEDSGPGISYALALTNGNDANTSLNRNSNLAYYARAAFHFSDYVAIGGAYMYDDNTIGEAPNRVDHLQHGWTADIQANIAGISLLSNIIHRTSDSPDIPQDAEVASRSYQIQIAYEEPVFGIQPAYRYAFYDPTWDYAGEVNDLFDIDELNYHTFGLNYNAQSYPVRVMANYTITQENAQRTISNDRFDLLLQLSW